MPLPFSFSADHLAKQGGSFEPLRSYNGSLEIHDNEFDALTLSLESFPLPKESSHAITLRRGAEGVKVPGPVSVADMSLAIRDFVTPDVFRELFVWRRSVYIPSVQVGGTATVRELGTVSDRAFPNAGGVGRARDIKRTGTVHLYAPDGTECRRYRLSGLWPLSLDPGDIDYANENLIRIRMNLSVDFIGDIEFAPAGGF